MKAKKPPSQLNTFDFSQLGLGILAGTAGTLAMILSQKAMSEMARKLRVPEVERAAAIPLSERQNPKTEGNQKRPATVRLAQVLSRTFRGKELSGEQEKGAGTLVHYATGAGIGACYGLAAGRDQRHLVAKAMLASVGVWLIVDEGLMPRLKLSKPASRIAPASHAYALLAHLAYGWALGSVFKISQDMSQKISSRPQWQL